MPGGQYIYLRIASFLISVIVQLHRWGHENIIMFEFWECLWNDVGEGVTDYKD